MAERHKQISDVCRDVIQNQENLSPRDLGCDRMCQNPFHMRKPLCAKGHKTTNQEDDSRSSFPLCPTPGAHMAQAYDKSRMSTLATCRPANLLKQLRDLVQRHAQGPKGTGKAAPSGARAMPKAMHPCALRATRSL